MGGRRPNGKLFPAGCFPFLIAAPKQLKEKLAASHGASSENFHKTW